MNRLFYFLLLLLFYTQNAGAQKNRVVRLDGIDNNLRIGMDSICRHWTLEAWIKPEGSTWKEQEVIIGGGEYSDAKTLDYLPLVLRNGVLYNTGASLAGNSVLPKEQWTHVAAMCNGRYTVLYVNGCEIARRDTATIILPGAIGINETAESIFKGCIDEVRIWETELTVKELKNWMYHPLTARHPKFSHLKGYYNFDDLADDFSANRAARGRLSFHLRNGRLKQYEKAPLAYAVENDNPIFRTEERIQELFRLVAVPAEWDADQGMEKFQLLKLRIETVGNLSPLCVRELTLDLSACTSLEDIDRINVYAAGNTPMSKERRELIAGGIVPEKRMKLKLSAQAGEALKQGTNYILITADISPKAKLGNRLKASVPALKIKNRSIVPEQPADFLDVEITASNHNNPRILKVLQWNIWHGGNHLGKNGHERIIELARQTHADIITLQEGYGIQQKIADALGFYIQTPSAGDNLALLSRYPLQKIATEQTFLSNPAIVSLPEGRKMYVNDCWLRYAYRPEYTCNISTTGMNPDGWAAEDSLLALKDAQNILENDMYPHVPEDIPAIVCGDFNSGSHLDWTPRAASLHYGYTAEKLPTSRFLLAEGFKDSFRELHPNEQERGEGTFAVIFGHSQTSRIDFIYYKGAKMRALSSRILRTMPEIDDVWPSDHAAVLTTFYIE